MSNKKTKGIQNHPGPAQKDGQGEKETTKRHVYVEPGVQIDLVEDFKKKYEASQSETTPQNKKQLLWTKVSAVLLFIYVGLTLWQARSAQTSLNILIDEQRPHVSMTKLEIMDSLINGKPRTGQEFEIGMAAVLPIFL